MRKQVLLSLLIIIPVLASAQYRNPKPKIIKANDFVNKKNKSRKEYIFGIGACNFLGELGGANQSGSHFIRDLDFSSSRPSLQLGMRYKFAKHFAVKGGLYYQLVNGSDKLTQDPYRENRNLSFRANIIEASVQGEFFLTKEKRGSVYRIRNARGIRNYDLQVYVFAGVGGFYYNPQAQYRGSWVSLQPLGTEGQGLPGGPKKYSRVALCIPYGLGASYSINKFCSVGLEIGMRYTTTDYIDDVSTVYYNNAAIASAHGPTAAALADPSLQRYPESLGGDATGYNQTAAGQQRGDSKHKDAYMFMNLTVSYKVPHKRRTRSKF